MSIGSIDRAASGSSDWLESLSQRNEESKPDYDKLVTKIFNDKDDNGDGMLTADEMGITKSQFTSIDTNGDGFASSVELVEHLNNRGNSNFMLHIARAMIEAQDTDGDGKISRSESQLSNDLFDAYDTDGDGSLTETELAAALGEQQKNQGDALKSEPGGTEDLAPELADDRKGTFALGDKDAQPGDSGHGTQMVDLNGDGVVSPEEVQAILQYGIAKAKTMVANGELKIESGAAGGGAADGAAGASGLTGATATGRAEAQGAASASDNAALKKDTSWTHGPEWLRRKAMQAYEEKMSELVQPVAGAESTAGIAQAAPAADDVSGAEAVAGATIAGTTAASKAAATATRGARGAGDLISSYI